MFDHDTLIVSYDAARGEPENPEQGMLAPAARRLERLRGEDEKAAGKERHHRQDVEIHAVGARRVAARLLQRFGGRDVNAGRQQRADRFGDLLAVGPLREVHIQAVQLPEPIQAPLRGGNVGEGGESLQLACARHLELHDPRADDQAQPLLPELGCRLREQHLVRREQLGPAEPQRVQPDHADGALGAGDAGLELEPRVHPRHAGQPGDLRVKRLGKAGAPASHLQARLAGEQPHGRGQVLDGGAVHEKHRVAERDTERDAGHREQRPAARSAAAEDEKQAQHRG